MGRRRVETIHGGFLLVIQMSGLLQNPPTFGLICGKTDDRTCRWTDAESRWMVQYIHTAQSERMRTVWRLALGCPNSSCDFFYGIHHEITGNRKVKGCLRKGFSWGGEYFGSLPHVHVAKLLVFLCWKQQLLLNWNSQCVRTMHANLKVY